MGDSLGLIGKRLLLLFNEDGSAAVAAATVAASGSEVERAAWIRGTVRAVSVIGLASPGVEVRPIPPPQKQQQHTVKQTKHNTINTDAFSCLIKLNYKLWVYIVTEFNNILFNR